MIYGYLRVSTTQQDVSAQKHGILEYGNKHGLSGIQFVEDTASGKIHWRKRNLNALISKCEPGDVLLFAEFSRIGRSTLQVLEFLHDAAERDVKIHIVKQSMIVDGSLQSRIMATVMGLVAEMEREFTSQRTKEGLRNAVANGKTLGRPKGTKAEVLKLDKDPGPDKIRGWIEKDLGMVAVAKLCGCSRSTLYAYCQERKITIPAKRPRQKKEKEEAHATAN